MADPQEPQKYIQKKQIPQLFQSLTIALVYSRPEDHVQYLIDCLEEVRKTGTKTVTWDQFLPEEQNGFPAQIKSPAKNHGTLVSGMKL